MKNKCHVHFLAAGVLVLLAVSGGASSGRFGDYAHTVTSADQMRQFNDFMQQPDAIYLTDNNDKTMLHYAAYFGTPEMVQRLIDAGADVNASGDIRVTLVENYESDRLYRPFTPLMAAIASGDERKVWLWLHATTYCCNWRMAKLLIRALCNETAAAPFTGLIGHGGSPTTILRQLRPSVKEQPRHRLAQNRNLNSQVLSDSLQSVY